MMLNPCTNNPCLNGVCSPVSNTKYTCTCYLGYTGTDCSTKVDYCNPNPCKNSANCVSNWPTSYECQCSIGNNFVKVKNFNNLIK
jgi:hypothetical protein